jgi:hypothetical protein
MNILYSIDSFHLNHIEIILNRNPEVTSSLNMGNHHSSIRNQFSISLNMVVSVVATFGICYIIAQQIFRNDSKKVLFFLKNLL